MVCIAITQLICSRQGLIIQRCSKFKMAPCGCAFLIQKGFSNKESRFQRTTSQLFRPYFKQFFVLKYLLWFALSNGYYQKMRFCFVLVELKFYFHFPNQERKLSLLGKAFLIRKVSKTFPNQADIPNWWNAIEQQLNAME